mmetsp:Transcript_25540/g.64050  ORF Transcript_25540/g.64050 Transcript_25540/m.64050 type:complete len:115 (-) Transcript_25540:1912-2256(-)
MRQIFFGLPFFHLVWGGGTSSKQGEILLFLFHLPERKEEKEKKTCSTKPEEPNMRKNGFVFEEFETYFPGPLSFFLFLPFSSSSLLFLNTRPSPPPVVRFVVFICVVHKASILP